MTFPTPTIRQIQTELNRGQIARDVWQLLCTPDVTVPVHPDAPYGVMAGPVQVHIGDGCAVFRVHDTGNVCVFTYTADSHDADLIAAAVRALLAAMR